MNIEEGDVEDDEEVEWRKQKNRKKKVIYPPVMWHKVQPMWRCHMYS